MHHILKKIVYTLAAILLMPLWLPLALRVFGFYVNEPGWSVAEDAVKKNDVSICQKILFMPWEIYSPSTKDQRWECIYRFAKNTKDPTACELLMPSEYGLACISNIVTNEYENRVDDGFFPFSECKSISGNSPKKDWCHYLSATRKRNSMLCKPIKNNVVREACAMKFAAWKQYPKLRNSSYFGRAAESES